MRNYLFALTFFISLGADAQLAHSRQEGLQLKKILSEHHVLPKRIDDAFSKGMFRRLLDNLDPSRLYLTSSDLGELKSFESRLDDEYNGNGWNFPDRLVSVFGRALKKAELNILSACEKPFNFKSLTLPDTTWAENDLALKQRMYNELALQAWEELTRGSLVSDGPTAGYFTKNEPDVRARVKQRALRDIRRQLNAAEGLDKFILATYFRTFSMMFDPHSVYMSPTHMQNFIASLSTEGYYLGVSLDENDQGEIVVTALHPGGPAWKSGAFNVGDVIEQVRWAAKEWVVVSGMTNEELGAILDESNDQALEFVLRKGTGISQKVVLRKEKFDTDYNVVRGFVLEGKHRIGYINLPDFYSDWGDAAGARCANDVAREILKMKSDGIEGMIFDLRFNGGGSLREAVSMAGIFIDAGPVGIDLVKGAEPETLKDMNRGTVWDGPLLLLVNGASASASEFLAAALQDYHRAIIAGNRTYGKGVAQELFSLESGKRMDDFAMTNSGKQWGFCAVTTSRMYRINGKSVQTIGVTPDIEIPQPGDELTGSETDDPFALPADSVSKKTYPQLLPLLPLATLTAQSQTRIDSTKNFQRILSYKKSAKDLIGFQGMDPASYQSAFTRYMDEVRKLSKDLETVKNDFNVNLDQAGHAGVDEYTRSINKAWQTHLQQDVSIGEAFHVVCDYIDISKHK